jgi:hypothetical protein
MITIKAEQEHYCLLTDGGTWTVVERRAGRSAGQAGTILGDG